MTINLAVATRLSANLIPADNMVNTFWFDSTGKVDGDNIADMLGDYYSALQTYISAEVLTTTLRVQIYDQSDPEPRVAWFDGTRNAATSATDALPREVALAMSFGAVPASGQPYARRRGRIYIGGIAQSACEGDGRPSSAFIGDVAIAGAELIAASNASISHQWVVWSRVDQAAYPVVGGAIDNAWDTQRRRGDAPTERTPYGPV